jgi:DNA mismatch repair ATPase MutS
MPFQDGLFAYSHRLRQGINRDSHGIKVAQLAGMPDSAVKMAHRVLAALKRQDMNQKALRDLGQSSDQLAVNHMQHILPLAEPVSSS